MDLKRRLVKLETSAASRQARIEPDYSEEDLACMQGIIDRIYADPERYANRIAIFDASSRVSPHRSKSAMREAYRTGSA